MDAGVEPGQLVPVRKSSSRLYDVEDTALESLRQALSNERTERALALQQLEQRLQEQIHRLCTDVESERGARLMLDQRIHRKLAAVCQATASAASDASSPARSETAIVSPHDWAPLEAALRRELSDALHVQRTAHASLESHVHEQQELSERRWMEVSAAEAQHEASVERLSSEDEELGRSLAVALKALQETMHEALRKDSEALTQGTAMLEQVLRQQLAAVAAAQKSSYQELCGLFAASQLRSELGLAIDDSSKVLVQELAELRDLVAEHRTVRTAPRREPGTTEWQSAWESQMSDVAATQRLLGERVEENGLVLQRQGAHLQKLSGVTNLLLASQEEMSTRLRHLAETRSPPAVTCANACEPVFMAVPGS